MDKFHRHEALDRTHVIMDSIDNYLLGHPYILENKKYNDLVAQAFMLLHEVYQSIGTESFNE
jgi:hypothetical protein